MNDYLRLMYKDCKIDDKVFDLCNEVEESLKERFRAIDEVAEYNQLKVLAAMRKNKVSDTHFNDSTGYGYDDLGRDTLEDVYADVFHTESALVRPNLVSGTHALTVALSAN